MNYLSVFVTTIIAFIIGALWYSPLLFSEPWIRLSKLDKKKMKKANKNMWIMLITGFVQTFIMVFMLDLFLNFLNVYAWMQGLVLGFLIWFGFIATTMFNLVLYERKPFTLFLINGMHYFVVIMISSVILAIWV